MLKWHIGLQTFVWGLLFPAGELVPPIRKLGLSAHPGSVWLSGMVLGMNKSRFHAPLQGIGALVTLLPGNFLGHHHGGESVVKAEVQSESPLISPFPRQVAPSTRRHTQASPPTCGGTSSCRSASACSSSCM